jgi:hypothetical protein
VRVTLLFRVAGASDSLIGTIDAPVEGGPDGGDLTMLTRVFDAGPQPASCGGRLVLRVEVLSGSSDFLQLQALVVTP